MSDIGYRDRQPAPTAPQDERLLATFAPDRARYIRDHVTIGAIGAVLACIVLLVLGKSHLLWAGILGTFAALTLRGMWLYSDVMALRYILTDKALYFPGGLRIGLTSISQIRSIMGEVQITAPGQSPLIRHQADPAATIATIRAAQ